jgi:hypothetical protein
VDNNYLDLGMNKSGFVHTLPSGRLRRGCREHHIIPMLPQHPAYQEQESVIVLLRRGGGARSCPRRPDRDSGRLHAQLCPDV